MAIRGVAGVTAFMAVSLWLYVEDGWYHYPLLFFAGLALPVAVGFRFGAVAMGAYVMCVAATFVEDFGVQAWSGSDNFFWTMWVWLVLAGASATATFKRLVGSRRRGRPASSGARLRVSV